MKKSIYLIILLIILILGTDRFFIGRKIDSYMDVPVYYNGLIFYKSYGKNYSKDGYYYGRKWQCVEYVKRFYYDKFNHEMPNVMGNAKDFFDKKIKNGEINKDRNLVQFWNGQGELPQINDLIVIENKRYGHVGIVSKVTESEIEIVQQNAWIKTKEKFKIINNNGKKEVGGSNKPIGWLRISTKNNNK